MNSTEDVLIKYNELKSGNDGVPLKYREFLEASGINKRALVKLFGANAYTKLQELAGDTPNKLNLKRTPLETIMITYGDLATEVISTEQRLPTASHWAGKDLRPTESGLNNVHKIKWSEFPSKFHKYCTGDNTLKSKYADLLKFIETSNIVEPKNKSSHSKNRLLSNVYTDILEWSPALRRNSEEAYKSELSHFLKQVKYLQKKGVDIREEKSDSRCDIAIDNKIGIEIKKSPSLSEYDRCFGQIARHLKNYKFVIVVIFDVPRQEQFEDFIQLVEKYFKDLVLVIKNG